MFLNPSPEGYSWLQRVKNSVRQCTVSLNQNSPTASPWMDAVLRLYPNGSLARCGKRKLELKYFSCVDITKEGFLNYKYNNRNLGQFCYLASSGQVSFAFLMKSWHLMPENSWKMSVNYSKKNIASAKADNRNFKTIVWNNLSSQPTSPIQALAMCALLSKLPLISEGVLNVSRKGHTAHISYCGETCATVTCDGLSLTPRSTISFTRSQKLSTALV